MTEHTAPELVSIGIIGKAHGIKGEVSVTPLTDNPQRFEQLNFVTIEYVDGRRAKLAIETVRRQGNRILLKFKEVTTRNVAETLNGAYVSIPHDELSELPEDSYYIFDLVGLEVVTTEGKRIGRLEEVLDFPANDVYVVKDDGKEYLIPAIKDVVKKVDLEKGIMQIEPIEGLLEEEH